MNANYDLLQKLSGGELAGWAVVALIILMSLIQVAPVRINPWDSILGWFGKKINGKMQKQLEDMETNMAALQKQVRDLWINSHRQSILTFAREARAEIEHSESEWTSVLNTIEEYEVFVKTNNISNGVVRADSEYIRSLYQKLSQEHRI